MPMYWRAEYIFSMEVNLAKTAFTRLVSRIIWRAGFSPSAIFLKAVLIGLSLSYYFFVSRLGTILGDTPNSICSFEKIVFSANMDPK
jgi:hypothetical protein